MEGQPAPVSPAESPQEEQQHQPLADAELQEGNASGLHPEEQVSLSHREACCHMERR